MAKLTAAQREQLAYQTEQKYGLPKGMLVAQLNTESSNGKNNYNAASGATGAMQFMHATAASMGVDPNDDTSAIDGAGKLMAQNLQQSNGNVAQAVKLYYAGSPKGIGPKSEAYAGTVAAHWNPDDAFDAAMGGNKQPVATAAPAQPAAPDNAQPDYDKSFDTAMSDGAVPPAGTTATSQVAPPKTQTQFQQDLAKLSQLGPTVNDVRRLYQAYNLPTDGPGWEAQAEKWVNPGKAQRSTAAPGIENFDAQQAKANALSRFGNAAGFGIQNDVFDTAYDAGNWLNSKTGILSNATQGALNDRLSKDAVISGAYNRTNAGDPYSLAGRVVGNVLATAPTVETGMGAIGAAGGLGRFAAGTAGRAILDDSGDVVQAGNKLIRIASKPTGWATQGALTAAASSGSSNAPLTAQMASGAKAGVGLGVLGTAAKAAGSPLVSVVRDAIPFLRPSAADQATNLIAQRVAQDANAGGPSLSDMQGAGVGDKPLTLMDVGGPNVQALAGRIARQPGPGRATIGQFLMERDAGAPDRITADVKNAINSNGSSYVAGQDLMQQRATSAAPLYETAFQGGSIAPLESQFEQTFQGSSSKAAASQKAVAAAQNEATQAAAQVSTAGDNVYAANQALARQKAAQQALTSTQQASEAAQAEHASNLDRLRQAQADGSANAPGAVWSPRIQQFLDDPIMQGGLKRGLEIQRIESVANSKPFNPNEYAIKGTDENGNPIVGAVPNMRLLDAGKRGLDAIIGDHTDPITGKVDEYGRAVTQFKKSYLGELDSANPDYAPARAAYSGPSQSLDALRQGGRVLAEQPEKTQAYLNGLSDGDKEFFRQGAADAILKKLGDTTLGGNEALKLMGTSNVRARLRPLFNSDADYNAFSKRVAEEHQMFQTKQAVLGNSATAGRVAEDTSPINQAGVEAAHGVLHAATGNWLGAGTRAFNALQHLGSTGAPAANSEMANIFTQPIQSQDLNSMFSAKLRGLPPYAAPNALQRSSVPIATITANRLRDLSAPQH